MDTFSERLTFVRLNKGLTNKQLGEDCGISESAFWGAIKRGKLREVYINIICEKYSINKDWLVNGAGDMEKKTITDLNTVGYFLRNRNGFSLKDEKEKEVEKFDGNEIYSMLKDMVDFQKKEIESLRLALEKCEKEKAELNK